MPAAETGSPSPAQAFRLDARPFGSGRARSSRAAAVARRSAWNAGGRPARSRHSHSSLAAGLASSPMAKRRSRERAFVGVEAQDLGGGRGALQREAGAQRPGGRRVATQEGVEQREAGAGEEQRIALPCPSARPRPGRDRRRRRKRLPFRSFRRARRRSRALAKRRRDALAQVFGEGGGEVGVGANHLAHGACAAALCQLICEVIRPACRGCGDVR